MFFDIKFLNKGNTIILTICPVFGEYHNFWDNLKNNRKNNNICQYCGVAADEECDLVNQSNVCYFDMPNDKQKGFKNENSKNSKSNLNPDESTKLLQTLSFKADDQPKSFVSFEYLVIKLIELTTGKKFKIKKQGIIAKKDKHYDILIIEEVSKAEKKQRMKLVFDISESWDEVYQP